MIAIPMKKIARPPSRTAVATRSRLRALVSSSMCMLPNQVEHVERLLGNGNCASLDQLARLMIAPADPDRHGTCGGGHGHVEAGVANDDRRLRRRYCIGHGLLDHRGVRFGRMAIGGLQRDEAGMNAMEVQAMLEPSVRLAGRDR